MNNIHPIFDRMLQREDKEKLFEQRAIVLWLTGLSGSGKSSIAAELERQLYSLGYHTALLDGDNIRTGINNNLGFSDSDRLENIRRIAEIAKLFYQNGIITICCFVSPTNDLRTMAREIIGEGFREVFINTPLEECERRDVKGLYKKARKGEIKDFTGIDAPFDTPINPDFEIKTVGKDIATSTKELLDYLIPQIKY